MTRIALRTIQLLALGTVAVFAAPLAAQEGAALAAPAPAPVVFQATDSLRFIGGTGNSALAKTVIAGNTIYLSGVLGSGAGPTIGEQATAVMTSIRNNLAEVGGTMDDVVKCLVFMSDLSERPAFNEVYRSFFPTHRPARSAIGVDLGGPKVEVECIAVVMR